MHAARRQLHDLTLAEGLRRLCLGLCVIFAVFTPLDALDLPRPTAWWICGQDLVLGVVFGAAYLAQNRQRFTRCPHLGLAACALLATSSPLLTYALQPEIYLLGHLLMILVGIGAFMLSWRWSTATMALVLIAGWLVVGLALDHHAAAHWGFLALVAVIISLSIQLARRGVLARLAAAGAQAAASAAELEQALAQVQAELTERQIAEEKLARERDAANQIVETAPAIVVVLDSTGRLLRANGRLAETTGVPLERALGQDFIALLDGADPQFSGERWHALLQGQDTVRGEVATLSCACGPPRLIEWHCAPLLNRAGERVGVLGMGLDITARVQAEQSYQALLEQLARAQKMELLGALAGGIAHDINNTLAAVTSLAQLVLEQGVLDARSREDLRAILQTTGRGAALTRNLLALGRKDVTVRQALHLHDVVTLAHGLLERTLPRRIRLEVELAATCDRVLGDPRMIEQVLMNLCLNAADAIVDKGRVRFETTTVQGPGGEQLQLCVRDDGSGMDEATRRRVFEPFFTTKEPGRGSGLGLAMVHHTVVAHGGSITCDSTPGQGTCFTIRLPLAREAGEGAGTSGRAAAGPGGAPDPRRE